VVVVVVTCQCMGSMSGVMAVHTEVTYNTLLCYSLVCSCSSSSCNHLLVRWTYVVVVVVVFVLVIAVVCSSSCSM